MPYVEGSLNLPRTGTTDKWEDHSKTVALPAGAEYTHTEAFYACPAHGPEQYSEGTDGHWFRFTSAVYDAEKGTVKCNCDYQIHDQDTRVTFRVYYRDNSKE